jgi:hypothetical protein
LHASTTPLDRNWSRVDAKCRVSTGAIFAVWLIVALAKSAVEVTMLVTGDTVPHFEVRTRQGKRFSYSSIWQRKNLLLVRFPSLDPGPTEDYITELAARLQPVGDHDLEFVITRDLIPGISDSAVLIADRWGEIVYAVEKSDVADLPAPRDVVEWVNYLNNRCPECEGEAR